MSEQSESRPVGQVVADHLTEIIADPCVVEPKEDDPLRPMTVSACEIYRNAREKGDVPLYVAAGELLLEIHKRRCRLRTL